MALEAEHNPAFDCSQTEHAAVTAALAPEYASQAQFGIRLTSIFMCFANDVRNS